MSEPKTTQIYTVSPETMTSVEISGAFYQRMTSAYFSYISKLSQEKMDLIFASIQEGKINDLEDDQDKIDAATIETHLILMRTIELNFKKAGDIKLKDIPLPTED